MNIMAVALLFIPLLSSLFVGWNSATISPRLAEKITTVGLVISALLSWTILYHITYNAQLVHITLLPWIQSDSFVANWSLYIDPLTAIMLIVVTSVSALVHIYSIGYMHEDPHIPRFMSYLSLFTFFMLMLVTADNFIQMFFGWEGVGLCSYLLIGFWFKKDSANKAAMKAFIVNRVGDIGFALGIFMIYQLVLGINARTLPTNIAIAINLLWLLRFLLLYLKFNNYGLKVGCLS